MCKYYVCVILIILYAYVIAVENKTKTQLEATIFGPNFASVNDSVMFTVKTCLLVCDLCICCYSSGMYFVNYCMFVYSNSMSFAWLALAVCQINSFYRFGKGYKFVLIVRVLKSLFVWSVFSTLG